MPPQQPSGCHRSANPCRSERPRLDHIRERSGNACPRVRRAPWLVLGRVPSCSWSRRPTATRSWRLTTGLHLLRPARRADDAGGRQFAPGNVVPMLVFGAGGCWRRAGGNGSARGERGERDGADVLFSGPAVNRRVPVSDIASVRRSRVDPQLVGMLGWRTRSHEVIRVAVQLHGARALTRRCWQPMTNCGSTRRGSTVGHTNLAVGGKPDR